MAKTPKKLNDDQIISQVRQKAQQAVKFSTDHIANKQEQALKLYNREALPGDAALKGKSKYVDPSVMERVDWSVAAGVRVFDGVEKVVEFLPNGPEDEVLARQQTDVINLIVRRLNSHVSTLFPWFKNGFITGLGIVTVRFDACTEEGLPETIKGVSDEQLVDLVAQEDAGEIIIAGRGEPYQPPVPFPQVNPLAAMQTMSASMVRDLKIRRIYKQRHMKILNIKPEEFIVSKDADFDQQTGGIKAHLQGHRRLMTRDELLEIYDKEKVEKIPNASDDPSGIAMERSIGTDNDQGVSDTSEEVEVYELYTKMKIDGEKARHYRITIGGDINNSPVLLDCVETTKTYPYAAFCPYPLPNTLFGHGVADRVGDDQTLLSKIRRAEIDNLNWVNNPTKVINQAVTNMDDALNIFPNSVIRSEAPDGGIKWITPPNTAGTAAPMTADIKTTLDFTTGVGGGMMAVNASDLQNTTATATSQRANSAQQFMETIFRVFADTGYRYLFRIITDLLIQNPEDAEILTRRLTNNYVPVKVDQFSPDLDLTTTVAFGVMNKDFNASMLNQILMIQQQLMGSGSPMVTPANMYSTITKIIENAGFKNPGAFITDPASIPPVTPKEPPPDPIIEAARIEAEQKTQREAQDREFEWRKEILRNDLERDRMAQDLEIKRAEINAKYSAQVDIARIQSEQAAQRNDMDYAIAAQTTQAEVEKARLEQQAQAAQQAQQQQAMQAQMQPQPPMGPMG